MFNIMKTALTTKRAPEEEILKIPAFIFRRWMANDPRTIGAINFFNIYDKVPVNVQYDVVQAAFGGKINYLPYPKKAKDDTIWLERVSKYYNVSLEKAKIYLDFLSEQDLINIQNELEELIPKSNKAQAQVQKKKGKN